MFPARYAGWSASISTAADQRLSLRQPLFVARPRLFPDPHTWAISILVNEDHSGLLERATYCIASDVARFTTSFELPNSDKTNVRGCSELLLRPIDKSASSTALSGSDHLGRLAVAVH